MNREGITRLEPGRELDRLVAERVMGWRLWESSRPIHWAEERDGCYIHTGWNVNGLAHSRPVWSPSTDITAAWAVVEHLLRRGLFLDIYSPRQNGAPDWLEDLDRWVVVICDWKHEAGLARAEAETLPLAICLAALEAVKEER